MYRYNIERINPHSKMYIIWCCLKLMTILFGCLVISINVCFRSVEGDNILYYILFLLSLFDIVLTFNVGIFVEGTIVNDLK